MTVLRSAEAALVLMYHRVAELVQDPFGICVHPETFAQHLECIQRHADIVALDDLRNHSGGRRVAITFDDGYSDVLSTARPILESYNAHATVFVVAGKVGSCTEFWWDKLEQLILEAMPQDPLDVDVGGQITIRLPLDKVASRERALGTLHAALMRLPPAQIDDLLMALARRLQATLQDRPTHQTLNLGELAELSASPCAEIGAHSMTHPAMPELSPDEQREEIEGSRSFLEIELGLPVHAFAYPFGEYDETTAKLVEEAGLHLACTAEPGRVTFGTDRFRIPRYEVRDWAKERFDELLTTWMQQ